MAQLQRKQGRLRMSGAELCEKFWNFGIKIYGESQSQSLLLLSKVANFDFDFEVEKWAKVLTPFFNFPIVQWRTIT